MAPGSQTLAETAAALYLLTYGIQNPLSTHRQPDAEQPHNASWPQEQRPNPMRTVAAATQVPSRNATLTDAERANAGNAG